MRRSRIRQPLSDSDRVLAQRCMRGRVVVIDDDVDILNAMSALFDFEGYVCETHTSAEAYLEAHPPSRRHFPGPCCVLCDVQMPGLSGLELQKRLAGHGDTALLLMSGASVSRDVVQAFHAGALDFLLKPIDTEVLLSAVAKALAVCLQRQFQRERQVDLEARLASLTERERLVARRVAQGLGNQGIATDLGIALRTVKLHRQRAMEKLQVLSLVDLARLADESGL